LKTVLFIGTVTEIIPRRKGFFYKITYEDGDQEDMDEAELQYGLELKHKKEAGEDISIENEGVWWSEWFEWGRECVWQWRRQERGETKQNT
jgi:hypothetical protein